MSPVSFRLSDPALQDAAPLGTSNAAGTALQVGGLQRFTTLDYPGALAAVVFVQGCPWRCVYCHNPQLQARRRPAASAVPGWDEVLAWLATRRGLLDAVVFSGGEPCTDPALPAALAEVKALGFRCGLHTAGMAPKRLQLLCAGPQPLVDWVGLDIKAPLADDAAHTRVTGVRGATAAVRRSLAVLLEAHRAHGLAYECRTTAHPGLLDEAALCAIGDELATAGVDHWALQICRTEGGRSGLPAVDSGYPSPATLAQLRDLVPGWVLRRA